MTTAAYQPTYWCSGQRSGRESLVIRVAIQIREDTRYRIDASQRTLAISRIRSWQPIIGLL